MDFDLIIALRIKGFAKPAAICETAGITSEQAQAQLESLIAQGWGEETRMGVRLTTAGKSEAQRRIGLERGRADPEQLEALYQRFCGLNDAFKSLVTDWQMRNVDGRTVVNDHKDAAHDQAVMGRLDDVHPRMLQLIAELKAAVPRLSGYARRFDAALQRLRQAEVRYLAAPIIDSYHTIWFELHQDLIQVCGLNRADEAAAGRAQ